MIQYIIISEISAQERSDSEAIAAQGPNILVDADFSKKVEAYGLMAYALRGVSFDGVRQKMLSRRYETMYGILTAFEARLVDACLMSATANDQRTMTQLDDTFSQLVSGRGWYSERVNGVERLTSGISTAIDAEGITLRSLQNRTENGQPLTRTGLYRSQRVPFKLTMLHISELDLSDHAAFDYVRLANGESGKVLTHEAAPMTSHQGLQLKAQFEPRPLIHRGSLIDEPRIGCPVTMIAGFIRSIHTIAADVATEAKLITLQD